MGCICSKEGFGDEFEFVHKHHGKHKETRLSKRSSLGKDKPANEVMGLISESAVEGDKGSTEKASHKDGHKNAMFRVKPLNWHHLKHPTKDHGKITGGQTKMSRIASMPNGDEAANIAAGWPSWLTAVAGNVVSGWAPRRADTFEKLEKIGQGTYSSVYRARDLESGKIVAMKKVRFANMDPESVRFMAREIHILRKLDHPNVMKLECLVTSKVSSSLYLVFEYMEHDLAGLAARPGMKFTESQIKCYMKQLFQGLEHCHSRGVLHRDIKGANLLIDNDGNLKIGDFGLATLFQHSQKQPLTSRVVTLWYRPPELLLGSTDYGVAVDLWSAGCILAELFQGKPIMPGRTEVEQLHKIFKLCGSPSIEYWQKSRLSNATMFKPQRPYTRRLAETFKDFPSPALTLLDVLLHVEPERRGSASLALQSEFFTKKPLPCAPSALPKYPPSKEFDARLRDAEARRQRAAAKGLGQELDKKEGRQNKTGPLLATNPQLEVSTQKHYKLPNPRSNSEKFNWEQAGSGLFIEPSRGLSQNDIAQSFHPLTSNSLSQSCKIQGREDEISTQPGHSSRFHAARRLLKLSRFASSTGLSGGAEVNEQHVSGDDIQPVKQAESNHTVDSQKESNKKDGHTFRKMFSLRRAPVKQLHCSGPLLRADENIDEMLKENEKNIQEAVRKARCDRMRTRKANADN